MNAKFVVVLAVVAIVVAGGTALIMKGPGQPINKAAPEDAADSQLQAARQQYEAELASFGKQLEDLQADNEELRKRLTEMEKEPAAPASAEEAGKPKSSTEQTAGKFIKSGDPELDKIIAGVGWDKLAKTFLKIAKAQKEGKQPGPEEMAAMGELISVLGKIMKQMGYSSIEDVGASPVLTANLMDALLEQVGSGLSESQRDELAAICSDTTSRIKQINANKDSMFGLEHVSQNIRAQRDFTTKMEDLLTQQQQDSLKEHGEGNMPVSGSSARWPSTSHVGVKDIDEATDNIYSSWKDSFGIGENDALKGIVNNYVNEQQQIRERYGAGPGKELTPEQEFQMQCEITARQVEALKKAAELNLTQEQRDKVRQYRTLDTFGVGESGSSR